MRLQTGTLRFVLLASAVLALGACSGRSADRASRGNDTSVSGTTSDTTSGTRGSAGTDTSTSGTSSGTSAGGGTAGSMATSPTPSSGMSGSSSK